MAQGTLERRVENLERRMTAVEQVLPTLATKADLAAAIAPLPTKADVRAEIEAAIAPLATKAGVTAEIHAAVRAEGAETRRHFDVVAEGLHADIRMVAEGVIALQARGEAHYAEIKGVLAQHDRRLTRLEASPSKRR